MAQKEIYRLDIKIGVDGDSETKKKLSATERFAKQSEKRIKALDKIKASPSVVLKDKLSKPLDKIQSRISKFSKFATSKFIAVATAGAMILGGLGVGSTMNTFMDFESKMSNVAAISEASRSELKLLTDQAKELGASTSFSASTAAEGMANLASAGFTVKETMTAMPGMLDLAAAGAVDVATASDIASSTLRGFGLEASKAGHVADVLAKTASATNAGITDTGEAMKYIAPVANSMGISLEEVSSAIGLMANSGIKGGQAGTTLRSALTRLASPSKEAAGMMKQLGFTAFDNKGKMLTLSKVVQNLQNSTKKLTDKQKQNVIATIFGQEAMSGMLSLIKAGPQDLDRLTQSFIKVDGAAEAMAKTQQDNLKGSLEELSGAVETLKINAGEKLAPYIKDFAQWLTAKVPDITDKIVGFADKIGKLAEEFNKLSPQTKKFILGATLATLTLAPLIQVIGGVTTGIGGLIGLGSKVGGFFGIFKGATVAAKATAKAVVGAEVATDAITGLGLAAKASSVLLSPWTWGIGIATIAGVKLYKHLKKDSIPEIQRFGDEVSKSTRKSLGAFMDLEEKATKSLNQLKWSGATVTTEVRDSIVSNFDEMTSQITAKLSESNQKSMDTLNSMFINSKTLSDKEKQQLISSTEKTYKSKEQKINEGNARIQQILNNASIKNRAINQAEYAEITRIKSEMMNTAVRVMSQGEAEQAAILEGMKANASILTAQQAAEVVRNSLDQKQKTIASANEEYNERLKLAAMLRVQGGAENIALADTIVREATRQKDEAVSKATSMHNEVITQAKLQASEHAAEVQWETGQVKSNFDVMMDKIREFNSLTIKEKVITITQKINSIFEKQNDSGMGTYNGPGSVYKLGKGYATGTSSATPGVHRVAEHGFEIITNRQERLFSGGEKVLTHEKSKNLLRSMFKSNIETENNPQPKFIAAKPQMSLASAGNNINVDVNMENNFGNDIEVDEIVKNAMQEFGYKLKEALKNIKK